MKLPSIDAITSTTAETIKRFPLVLLSAFIFALFCWVLIDDSIEIEAGSMFSAVLGLSLFLGIDLLAERRGSHQLRIILSSIGVALLILYGTLVGGSPKDDVTQIYRFGLFLLVVHLFVAIAPFIRGGSVRAFWEFNKSLFLRFLLSALFSGVLAGGLSIAMLAVDQLLLGGGTIKEQAYAKLCIVIGTLFNTIFFLADIPTDFKSLEEERPYPKGLKIFAQNLLLPLVVLYMSILYVYAITIIAKWEWPKGWIGWLVLSFSVLGILALLLLHPLQEREESRWIKRFSRWFYVAVLPLIGLLFAAAFRRIAEYGITENRYFILLLACWLGGMAIYFLASRKKNIKIVPISLAVAALFTSFGPWSAFAVSTNSQLSRLEELMKKNAMLKDGKIDSTKGEKANDDDKGEMRSIVHYLGDRDELGRIIELMPKGISADTLSMGGTGWVTEQLGISSTPLYGGAGPGQLSFSLSSYISDPSYTVDIADFDVMKTGSYNYYSVSRSSDQKVADSISTLSYGAQNYTVMLRRIDPLLFLLQGADTILRFDIAPVIASDIGKAETRSGGNNDSVRTWIVDGVGTSMKGRLVLTSVNGYYSMGDSAVITNETAIENMSYMLMLGWGLSAATP